MFWLCIYVVVMLGLIDLLCWEIEEIVKFFRTPIQDGGEDGTAD